MAESFTGRGGAPRPVFHEPRRPRLRAGEPPRGRQGRALRPLLPLGQVPAPPVPRRVRRDAERGRRAPRPPGDVGVARAESLYERVFIEYGDDSVAQLGGVHLACEGVSNVLTKLLEWGRLMAYLEQSTRYVPYADRPGGRWRYHVPAEVRGTPVEGEFEADARPRVRDLCPLARADAGALPAASSAPAGGFRGGLPQHDPREGARHPPRAPPGRDAVERGPLRHGPGVRGAAPAPARVARSPRPAPARTSC